MRFLLALAASCALILGSAAAQQTSSPPPVQQPYPQTTAPAQQFPQTVPQGTETVNAQNGAIPAGTQLSIRTNENIVADQNSAGRVYSAEIAQDVADANGRILIPRGSPATLTVGEVKSGTLGVGSNEVALGLQSVTVNGHPYNIAANGVAAGSNRGIGANKRTAEMTGGGALLGTLIGAVAGGGKGAAIGAVTGAGAGAAAQVLTRGKQVNVPAESVLTFRLDQPLMLQ